MTFFGDIVIIIIVILSVNYGLFSTADEHLCKFCFRFKCLCCPCFWMSILDCPFGFSR